jgi:hypothetical protein
MTRLIAIGLSAVLALPSLTMAPAARAATPSVDDAFGKTIVSTYPDGRKGELWLQRDGRYTAKGRKGDPSSGHWKIKGAKLCLNQSRPIPVPFSYCTPIPHSMHASWTAKAVTGERIRVSLAGR